MSDEQACCAHLHVNYATEFTGRQLEVRGYWQCTNCAMTFTPSPIMERQVEALKAERDAVAAKCAGMTKALSCVIEQIERIICDEDLTAEKLTQHSESTIPLIHDVALAALKDNPGQRILDQLRAADELLTISKRVSLGLTLPEDEIQKTIRKVLDPAIAAYEAARNGKLRCPARDRRKQERRKL